MPWEPRKELFTLERPRESEVQQKTSVTRGSDVGHTVTKKGSLESFTGENTWGPLVPANVITAPQTRHVIYFSAISVTILIEVFMNA